MPQPSYPLLLDVSDRLCAIVGGGAVAVRKANGLINAGAQRVHMIAPMFSPEVPKTVRCIHDCYRPEYLDHAGLIFAATNLPEVNNAVVRDAQERGIWVSRADDNQELPGDFLTPARFEKGPVTVAVSAGSAALSVMIRDQLALHWELRWTTMAEAMIQLRPEIKAGWDETTRRNIFRDLATVEAMDVLATGGIDALRHWIGQRHGVGI